MNVSHLWMDSFGMRNYKSLIINVLDNGLSRGDRTGTGTIGLFGEKLVYDLLDGFPVVSLKQTYWKLSIKEKLWMISGSRNNNDLKAAKVTIWDEWALPNGDLGPVYGSQWRHWPVVKKIDEETIIEAGRELQRNGATNLLDPYYSEIDQIQLLVDGLKNNPFSRRHILTAWNWSYIPDEKLSPHENVENGMMCLAPCHMMAQFYVSDVTKEDVQKYIAYQKATGESYDNIPTRKLSCQLYCRSQDLCLGTPFNLVGYATLTMILAKQCGYMPGVYHHVIGDAHIYKNHIYGAEEMVQREPFKTPYLKINNNVASIFDYKIDDFELVGYKYHPPISFDISI